MEDQSVFNRVLRFEAKLEYSSAFNNHYTNLLLAENRVGSMVHFRDGGNNPLDSLVYSRVAGANSAINVRFGVNNIPIWYRAVWNGSRDHIRIGATGSIYEPGRVAFFYSTNGTNWFLRMLQRPAYDLRPNDDHGQTWFFSLFGVNYNTFPTFEHRWSYFSIEELEEDPVGGWYYEKLSSSKKAWTIAHQFGACDPAASNDGGQNWSNLTGTAGSILNPGRCACWTGDMQGAKVLTPFATGNRDLWIQTLTEDTYIRTMGGGAANRQIAVFAGDGQQNTFSRDRCGLLAFASAGSDNLVRVEYNFRGFFGPWTVLTNNFGGVPEIYGLWIFSPTLIYVAGSAGGGRIWKYNGAWSTEVSLGGGTAYGPIHAFSETEIICVCRQSATLQEYNGVSWTGRTLPLGADRPFDVWGVQENDGQKWWYVAGQTSTGARIWRKRPGDATWSLYGPVLGGVAFGGVHPFGDGSLVTIRASGSQTYRLSGPAGSWVTEDTAVGTQNSLHGTVLTDVIPPVLQNTSPSSGETVNDPETFYLEVIDENGNLDAATVVLSVSVDGGIKTDVWSSGAQQNGAIVTDGAVTNGRSYDVRLPTALLAESSLRIHVLAYDTHANLLDTSYPIYVTLPPGTLRTVGPDFWLTDGKDNKVDDDGHLVRDSTGVAARAKRRLLIQRGRWVGDPAMGSRLHELKTLTNARKRVDDYVYEALLPLLLDGSVSSFEVGEIEVREPEGYLFVTVGLVIPGESGVTSLGEIPLG